MTEVRPMQLADGVPAGNRSSRYPGQTPWREAVAKGACLGSG
jgi:hypothetical protein